MNSLKLLFLSLILVGTLTQSTFHDSIDSQTSYATEEYLVNESDTRSLSSGKKIEDEILEKLEDELVHFVTFAFCDIVGNLKEIALPIEQAKNVLKHGILLRENDFLLKPDLESLRFLPWTSGIHRTAWFMCTLSKDFSAPYEGDPRSILRALCKGANDLGYDFNASVILDFFLLEKNEQGILVPTDQAHYQDPEYNLSKQQEINLFVHALQDFGIEIEMISHGQANGQWQLSLKSTNALKTADNIVACKYALKVLTAQLKQHVSFMPKPFNEKGGNTMVINYTLVNQTNHKNAFYDELQPSKLSTLAKKFLAGNLETVIELSAITTPTVNSYKNISSTLFTHNSSAQANAVFNTCVFHDDVREEKANISFMLADGTANSYLTLAGLLKSGMQGIKKFENIKDPLTSINNSGNEVFVEPAANLTFIAWPASLNEALAIFEKSAFAKELLTDREHTKYVDLKKCEWLNYAAFTTDWETKKYL